MAQLHVVRLTAAERSTVRMLLAAGSAPARTLTHARILLKADRAAHGPAWTDARIAEALECSSRTVARVRARYCQAGLDAALTRRPSRRIYTGKLDGAAEAQLLAIACGPPPAGRAAWTLRLLAEPLVALEVVASIAPETVRQTLKRTCSARG